MTMMFDDLTKVNVPFGLLDRDTQEALKAHGGPLEKWNGACWHDNYIPGFDCALTYRAKPMPDTPQSREWWANVSENGHYGTLHARKDYAEANVIEGYTTIRVREITN